MSENSEKSRYFQEITRRFLARRGAPFFLSARDLDLISSWEKAGIPLPVVLEGIEKAFENYRAGPEKKSKIHSLTFCKAQVARAFERHRERKVGRIRKTAERSDKRIRVQSEVEKFLKRIPPEADFLKSIYLEAQKKVAGLSFPDEDLERLDEDVERLLSANASAHEREAIEKEILAEHYRWTGEELEKAAEIKLVKYLRDKYGIPYLSPYYY